VQLFRVMREYKGLFDQGNLTMTRVDALGRDDGGLGATQTKSSDTVKGK
jgi:hypothetical protein